jgi:hypothetical protein
MRKHLGRLLAPGLVVAALPASPAAHAQAMHASDTWQYREESESCRAYRWFGTGQDRVALQLRSFGPGSAIETTVVSPQLPREPSSVRHVELSWDGEAFAGNQVGLLGTVGGIPTASMLLAHRSVSAFAFRDEGSTIVSSLDPASETMKLRVVGGTPMELQAGTFEEPLRRLADCEADLMEEWGWGRDYAQRVARGPVMLDPQRWFYTAITYPAVPLLKHMSSILQVRLKVDATGKVVDCVVQSSPGSGEFGSKNCDRMRRMARFSPARDSQGQPVESYYQMSITFALYDLEGGPWVRAARLDRSARWLTPSSPRYKPRLHGPPRIVPCIEKWHPCKSRPASPSTTSC